MMKSPLKWAGGKSWAVPVVRRLREQYNNGYFMDLFGGSGVVSLNVANLGKTVYSDINWDLVNFYESIKCGELDYTLERNLVPFENDKNVYYENRKWFNSIPRDSNRMLIPNGTRAALFYYLNRTGYNGLCRYNRKGGFNVPFGSHKTINYCTDFSDIRISLQDNGVVITNSNAFNLIAPSDSMNSGDGFYYLDPPYHGTFTNYAGVAFGIHEQRTLIQYMSNQRAPVLYHNSANLDVISWLTSEGILFELVDVKRSISSSGDRSKAPEVLAYKNIARQEVEDALNAREKTG